MVKPVFRIIEQKSMPYPPVYEVAINYPSQWESLHAVTWGDSRYIGRTQGDGSPAQVQGIPSGESIVQVRPSAVRTRSNIT